MISEWLRRARGTHGRDRDIENGELADGAMREIPLRAISANPYQPRQVFHASAIEELAESIRRVGVIEPIVVRPHPVEEAHYQLLVGERRVRAARAAGLREIPAVVRDVDEHEMALLSLVENLQREDLHALEEAKAMQRMLDEFSLTQEELARGLGVSQSGISNKLRLLNLSEGVQDSLLGYGLSERHARALLRVPDEGAQLELIEAVYSDRLSVKEMEKRIEQMLSRTNRVRRQPMKGIVRDLRIFINGFRQTADAVRDAGFDVQVEEVEMDEGYRMIVEMRRAKPDGEGSRSDE